MVHTLNDNKDCVSCARWEKPLLAFLEDNLVKFIQELYNVEGRDLAVVLALTREWRAHAHILHGPCQCTCILCIFRDSADVMGKKPHKQVK